jgi:hypothetical protein
MPRLISEAENVRKTLGAEISKAINASLTQHASIIRNAKASRQFPDEGKCRLTMFFPRREHFRLPRSFRRLLQDCKED